MKAFLKHWKLKDIVKNQDKARWEEDYTLLENEGLFDEYLEMGQWVKVIENGSISACVEKWIRTSEIPSLFKSKECLRGKSHTGHDLAFILNWVGRPENAKSEMMLCSAAFRDVRPAPA